MLMKKVCILHFLFLCIFLDTCFIFWIMFICSVCLCLVKLPLSFWWSLLHFVLSQTYIILVVSYVSLCVQTVWWLLNYSPWENQINYNIVLVPYFWICTSCSWDLWFYVLWHIRKEDFQGFFWTKFVALNPRNETIMKFIAI